MAYSAAVRLSSVLEVVLLLEEEELIITFTVIFKIMWNRFAEYGQTEGTKSAEAEKSVSIISFCSYRILPVAGNRQCCMKAFFNEKCIFVQQHWQQCRITHCDRAYAHEAKFGWPTTMLNVKKMDILCQDRLILCWLPSSPEDIPICINL